MKIIDLKGQEIEVADLKAAIEQTAFFKDCSHVPPVESDKERQMYWADMHKKLLRLRRVLKQPLRTYTLTGRDGNADVQFTIVNLVPVLHKRHYSSEELMKFLIYTQYEPDWANPMAKEHALLYGLVGNPAYSFFKVANTGVIVIPGTYVYSTELTEQKIKELDDYRTSVQ